MYMRFVVSAIHGDTGAEAGFFQQAYCVARDEARVEDWLRLQLRAELNWFDDRLDVPEELARRFKRRRTIHGVCWFRPEAGDHIRHARYAAWLMTEAGVPVREIRIDHPGQILWSDRAQVVAKPPRDLPRAFA